MKHTSKALLDLMRKEAEEDRPSIEEMIQQMEYKLNRKIALLENTIRFQMNVLHISLFTPPLQILVHLQALSQANHERRMILQMPASPIFKKGGFHHKFTKDEASGEFIMKHPPKNETLYPEPIRLHLF